MKKILVRIGLGLIAIIICAFFAFKFTPWPSALIIRYAFNKQAFAVNEALSKHVPQGIISLPDLQYNTSDKDARLDVYYPSIVQKSSKTLPVIVWVHGGGWISGNKAHISNYCKILAAQGYVAVSIDYSIAPEKKYPIPVVQSNASLAYLLNNAQKLHINPNQFILAGDSGGANIVSQLANVITDTDYARLMNISPSISKKQLSGLLLYCGPYDAQSIDQNGSFGIFIKTVLWSYSGKKDFLASEKFRLASVIDYVTDNFPASFISAGNDDPLLPQSKALARKLKTLNVNVDTLFFKPDYSPKLPHEYQFNLDNSAGELALKRSLEFLKNVTN
nr:alpha/beta hydrolase [Pedobacter panaciterrae]